MQVFNNMVWVVINNIDINYNHNNKLEVSNCATMKTYKLQLLRVWNILSISMNHNIIIICFIHFRE